MWSSLWQFQCFVTDIGTLYKRKMFHMNFTIHELTNLPIDRDFNISLTPVVQPEIFRDNNMQSLQLEIHIGMIHQLLK